MAKQLILGDLKHELGGTRRMLACVPDEQLDWKPHGKSMSLGGLATHIVNILFWQTEILRNAELDLATLPLRREPLPSRQAMLDEFDSRLAEVEELLDAADEASLGAEWTLKRGDAIMYRQPRALALRNFGISHLVHHRAQLSVYLRLLDVPVPGLYGPSADDMQGLTSQA